MKNDRENRPLILIPTEPGERVLVLIPQSGNRRRRARTMRGTSTGGRMMRSWVSGIIIVVLLGVLIAPDRLGMPMSFSVGSSPSPTRISSDKDVSLSTSMRSSPPGHHSVLGPPTVTAEQIDRILADWNSPAVGTGRVWVERGIEYGIDPVYALAFFIHESGAGTAPGWAGRKPDGSTTHNVGNIICAGYPTCYGRFRDYPTWEEGIADWYRLIAVEYIGWRGVHTVEEIVPIYAPSFENNVDAYIATVNRLVPELRSYP